MGYFRDDEPGMLALDYRPDIDWESDGLVDAVGQVWYAGGGWWAVTATHTYATPGEFSITLTVNDTHSGGMSTTTYSWVDVRAGTAPGGGNLGLMPDLLAAVPPAAAVPTPRVRPAEYGPAPQLREAAGFQMAMPEADVVAALVTGLPDEKTIVTTGSEPSAWLGDGLVEALTANLLGN